MLSQAKGVSTAWQDLHPAAKGTVYSWSQADREAPGDEFILKSMKRRHTKKDEGDIMNASKHHTGLIFHANTQPIPSPSVARISLACSSRGCPPTSRRPLVS